MVSEKEKPQNNHKTIDLNIPLNDFINESSNGSKTESAEFSFENIDSSLQELTENREIDDKKKLEVNFSDGYSLTKEEKNDNTLIKVSSEEMSDITIQKNPTGELEKIEIEGNENLNLVFNVPETNLTIDPFLDGKISSYKNPKQRQLVILKIGTSSITTASGKLNYAVLQNFAEVILKLKEQGYNAIIVSSGAKGLGRSLLQNKCLDISAQGLTAIGQSHLITTYDNVFKNYDLMTAQILLAYNDLEYKENIRNTIKDLLCHGIVPIINANDPVICSDNIDIDNDKLAAAIGKITNASHLFLVSDSAGLYDADPKANPDANLIKRVSEINEEIEALASASSGSGLGTGGIRSKIIAARSCLIREAQMGLISKDQINCIPDIVKDPSFDFSGTLFINQEKAASA